MLPKIDEDLLHRSLDGAFVAHFGKLFSVLVTDHNEMSFERFKRGFTILMEQYARVAEEVGKWEP